MSKSIKNKVGVEIKTWVWYYAQMKKRGKIIPNGVVLKEHENATVVFLTELGYDVELIPKSNVEGVHTPDVIIDRIKWEMKSPKGEGKYLIANTIQRAVKQSNNIIIDLRRTKRHQAKCLHEIEKEFVKSNSIKRLKVIMKNNKIVDFINSYYTIIINEGRTCIGYMRDTALFFDANDIIKMKRMG